jgi:small subunit ribosomal protein S16
MSVALRLSRGGSKKRPFFRIVAADIRAPRDGRFLERLGTYNPMKNKNDPQRITLNIERIKYWLSVGAKPTERVQKFLANEKLAEKPLIYEQTKQDKPRKKTLEKIKAKEEKDKAKQEMEKAAEAAPQPTTDKPAEATSPPAAADKPAEAAPQPSADKPAEAASPPAAADKPAEAASPPPAAADKPAEAAPQPTADKPAEVKKSENGGEQK